MGKHGQPWTAKDSHVQPRTGMDRLSMDSMGKVLSVEKDVHQISGEGIQISPEIIQISQEISYRRQETPLCKVYGGVSCLL